MLTKGKVEQRFTFASPPAPTKLEVTACQIKEPFLGSGCCAHARLRTFFCPSADSTKTCLRLPETRIVVSPCPSFHSDLLEHSQWRCITLLAYSSVSAHSLTVCKVAQSHCDVETGDLEICSTVSVILSLVEFKCEPQYTQLQSVAKLQPQNFLSKLQFMTIKII